MSSPPTTYRPSHWRPDRLRLACRARGVDQVVLSDRSPPTLASGLRRVINEHRCKLDPNAQPLDWKAAPAWLDGSRDPSRGRTGHDVGVFEIADALGISVDWLMDRVDDEPGLPPAWRALARAQGVVP